MNSGLFLPFSDRYAICVSLRNEPWDTGLGSDGVCVPNAFGNCFEGNYFVLTQTDIILFYLNKMSITSHFCVKKRDGKYWIRSIHCWDLLRRELSIEETHTAAIFFFPLVAQLNFAFRDPIGLIMSIKWCHIIRKMPKTPRKGGWKFASRELELKKKKGSHRKCH